MIYSEYTKIIKLIKECEDKERNYPFFNIGNKKIEYIIDIRNLSEIEIYEMIYEISFLKKHMFELINSGKLRLDIKCIHDDLEIGNIKTNLRILIHGVINNLYIHNSEINFIKLISNKYDDEILDNGKLNTITNLEIIGTIINKIFLYSLKAENIYLKDVEIIKDENNNENQKNSIFEINGNEITKNIRIFNLKTDNINIINPNIKKFYIDGKDVEYNNFRIHGLKKYDTEVSYEIKNINTKNFEIDNISTTNLSFNIFNINVINNFIIINSNLGNIIFDGIDFTNKKLKIFFKSVILINSYFNNINWGNFKLESKIDNEKKIDNTEKKDIYRQLKNVMDQNKNSIDGNYFFTKEMDTILFKTDKKIITNNIISNYNLIPILLNKIISNYGNNYLWPLIWIILLTLWIIIIDNNITYKYIIDNIINSGAYHLLLNELANKINPFSGLSEYITFLQLFRKIMISYLIYSFGVAIKRTSKR